MSKIAIEGNASGTGTLTIAAPNTNTNRTLNLPDAAGTFVVSGTTPSLNGVTFPASQVASADANTLDDYEEGTFDVTLTPASGSITLNSSVNSLSYTRIGRLVTCTGNIVVSSVSSPTGSITFSGLPFSVAALSENSERFAGVAELSGWTSGNGCGTLLVDSGTSGSILSSTHTVPVCQAGAEVYFGFSYFAA